MYFSLLITPRIYDGKELSREMNNNVASVAHEIMEKL